MAPAHHDSPASTIDSPIDRALMLAAGGEDEAALRWGAALVKSAPAGPVGLLITGRLLAKRGSAQSAADALVACVGRSIDGGNLPLAVVACRDLESMGVDPAPQLDQIARCYSAGSQRLLEKGAQPPSLPRGHGEDFAPFPAALSGQKLTSEAEEAVLRASAMYESEVEARGVPPKVPAEALFSALDQVGLRAMIGIFDTVTVPAGTVLIEQGTSGAEAYIVARGELEVRRSSGEDEHILLARLGGGALIGEMSLLSRSPRAASVVAVRPSVLLVARKDSLDSVAAQEPAVGREFAAHCRRRMVENLVRTSSILGAVKAEERPALFDRFVTRTFEQGDKLIVQGQESDGLHLVASGEVAVQVRDDDDSTVVATLGVGEVVGEVALVLRRPSNADVVAVHPTVTLHLPRDRFLDLIKQHPAILAQLYELAIKRDEETSSIVAQEATVADDFVLI